MAKKLPFISPQPSQYPDCCCTISETLILALAKKLPSGQLVTLSIGCGTGLLEALLVEFRPTLHLEAVEVNQDIVQYLSHHSLHVVKGTWDLCITAGQAEAWLFVYPREVSLIDRYCKTYAHGAVRVVIWIGPKADLEDYGNLLEEGWTTYIPEDCGLGPYESMVTWRKQTFE